jgi:cobalt-zinc-cadmium resistance protein CzcA
LIEKLDEKLKDVPGVVYNFTQPLAMRLDEVISGVKADVAVMLFGDDPATLEREARKIENILRRARGSADAQIETLGGAAELQIAVNRAEMARYGLRVEDIKELIETAGGGGVATEVIDGRKRFDVVVPLALLLIFLLLYSTFNSLRFAALIIAKAPFALVGGVAAVWMRRHPSRSAVAE